LRRGGAVTPVGLRPPFVTAPPPSLILIDAESHLDCRRAIEIRKSKYLSNRIEQDHRRIKRRVMPMLGFKSQAPAAVILGGIEMVHMMRKRQARYAFNPAPSIAEQFAILAA